MLFELFSSLMQSSLPTNLGVENSGAWNQRMPALGSSAQKLELEIKSRFSKTKKVALKTMYGGATNTVNQLKDTQFHLLLTL